MLEKIIGTFFLISNKISNPYQKSYHIMLWEIAFKLQETVEIFKSPSPYRFFTFIFFYRNFYLYQERAYEIARFKVTHKSLHSCAKFRDVRTAAYLEPRPKSKTAEVSRSRATWWTTFKRGMHSRLTLPVCK